MFCIVFHINMNASGAATRASATVFEPILGCVQMLAMGSLCKITHFIRHAQCQKAAPRRNVVASLTLTLPGPSAGVSGSLDSYCSLKPLCSGMGEVVPARTSPTLLSPSPRTVLSLSCFKVLQCINCRDWHYKS